MLSIRDLRIDPACLGKKILVDIAPFYVYTPEKKRTDVIQGYRYTVALPDLHLEKISVKIDGNQLIEKAAASGCRRGQDDLPPPARPAQPDVKGASIAPFTSHIAIAKFEINGG